MLSVAQAGQSSQFLDALPMESRSEINAQRLSGRLEELEELAAVARMPGRNDVSAKAPVPKTSASQRINRMKSVPPDPVVRNGGISSFVPKEQATPDSESSAKSDKSRIMKAWDSVTSLTSVLKPSFKLPFSNSEQKQSRDAQDDELLKAMPWRFRDKSFVLVKGMWIDQEYRSEMREWRCSTLTRNSEEYKQALAKEPQLKSFFDKGPILIVWKNRIYIVLPEI
ncbi:MAG TPA: hypothetical protein VI479_17650 [Blastocatellia bacterium]